MHPQLLQGRLHPLNQVLPAPSTTTSTPRRARTTHSRRRAGLTPRAGVTSRLCSSSPPPLLLRLQEPLQRFLKAKGLQGGRPQRHTPPDTPCSHSSSSSSS